MASTDPALFARIGRGHPFLEGIISIESRKVCAILTAMDKRIYPRSSFREPVNYQMAEDADLSGSLASDISQGGVCIRIQEFIPLRSVLQMKIHLNNPPRTVPVKGEVVWIREVPHSEVFDVGIKFLETNMKLI